MRAPDTLPPEVQRDLDAMDAAVAGRRPDGGDAVLAELAALLAETRPVADPGWTRELDARAADGFAKPKRAARFGGARRSRLQLVLAPAAGLAACAVIAVSIGLAGSGSGGDAQTMGGSSSAGSESAGSSSSASSADKAAPAAGGVSEQSRSTPR